MPASWHLLTAGVHLFILDAYRVKTPGLEGARLTLIKQCDGG